MASDADKDFIRQKFKDYLKHINLITEKSEPLYNAYFDLACEAGQIKTNNPSMKVTTFIISLFIRGLAHKTQNDALAEICDNISKSYENFGFDEATFIKDDSFDQD